MSCEICNQIFITHSPYHALVACAIANQSDDQSQLCFQPYFPKSDARPLFDLINRTKIFRKCHLFQSLYNERGSWKSRIAQFSIRRNNIKRMRKIIDEDPVSEISGVLDDRDITQFAMEYAVTSKQNNIRCSVLEDGLAAYKNQRSDWSPYTLPLLHKIIYKILYGYDFQPRSAVTYYGGSKFVNILYAQDTTNVCEQKYINHEKKPINSFPSSNFNEANLKSYFEEYDIDWELLCGIDVVLLGLNNDNQQKKEIYEAVVSHLSSKNKLIGYKPHPRIGTPFQFTDAECVRIPPAIPTELLFASNDVSPDIIIGFGSTALSSTKWISPQSRSICLHDLVNDSLADGIKNLFMNKGVEFPPSVDFI